MLLCEDIIFLQDPIHSDFEDLITSFGVVVLRPEFRLKEVILAVEDDLMFPFIDIGLQELVEFLVAKSPGIDVFKYPAQVFRRMEVIGYDLVEELARFEEEFFMYLFDDHNEVDNIVAFVFLGDGEDGLDYFEGFFELSLFSQSLEIDLIGLQSHLVFVLLVLLQMVHLHLHLRLAQLLQIPHYIDQALYVYLQEFFVRKFVEN